MNRQTILDQAIHDCFKEMYVKAQPSADWDQIIQEFKDGKLSRAVLDKCFEKGLVIELAGRGDSVLKILPALTIDKETLVKGLNIIKESIIEVKNL